MRLRPDRPARAFRSSAALLLLVVVASLSHATDIYVLDARLESDGRETISPTFIVTPGERALLAFDGERDLDVAMTLTPRAGVDASADDAFDLTVELVDGVESHDATVPVSLAETETLELAGRVVKVLVRVQEALEETSAPAATAAEGN